MPTEKITNGDFSSGLSGWTVNNPTGGGAPTPYAGSVSFNRYQESVYGDSIEQSFTATIGRAQTVTMDLFENNVGFADHTFQIDILDSNGNVIATETHVVPNNSTVNVNFTFVPTTTTSTIRITNTTSTETWNTDGKVDNVSIVCFANGTMIETISGPVLVEKISAGTLVKVLDGSFKRLKLALSRKVSHSELSNEKLRPVRIAAGALGGGLPKSDLLVSRQHRMLVTSKIVKRMFGTDSVLLPAIKLTELPSIFIDSKVQSVEYFHLMFDEHEIVYANGAPSESFHPGPNAIAALTDEARNELFVMFPELTRESYRPKLAHLVPKGTQQRTVVSRHLNNNKSLLPPAFAEA